MSTDPSLSTASSPIVRTLHYAVVAVLILGGLYYVVTKPPSLSPIADKQAAEALAMVQTHQAIGYPTILQAMNEHVRSMKERGQGVRLGEWRVKQVEGDIYEIRLQLRDQSVNGQWYEREFIWHAHLGKKKVNAASVPADGVTPMPPDSDRPQTPAPPLPGAPPMPPMPGSPGV
jgi:hypothetical protein